MTSQINPNLIDGAYPVAGQDNNSQGFRDNFTNIKTNFQYAEGEINDLQTNALLKAPLTGTTLDNNMGNALILAAQIQAFSATKVSVASTSGTITLNYQSGHYQSITTSGTITLGFTGWAAAPAYNYMKIQLVVTNTAHQLILPAAVSLGTSGIQGYSAGTITFGATGTYEFGFGTYDNGSTITIFDLNRALTNFTTFSVSTLSASGNITGGNINAGATVSAVGNIVGGNVLGGANVNATIHTGTTVSVTGNVTGGNINGFVRPTSGSASQAPILLNSGTNTSTAAAGAIEFDGVVFYTSPGASQRGLAPSTFIRAQVSNNVLSDVATAQAVFSSPSAVSLSGTTSYEFEATYLITRAAGTTSHTTAVLFNCTNALTSIAYVADVTTSTGVALTAVDRIYGTGVTGLTVTGASTSATENLVITLRGIMRTNSATVVTPQFQYSAAPGGAPTVLPNSYIKFTPLGNSTVASIGNWA